MIRMITAHTAEIDDIELAVAEIHEQLNLKERLLENAVGMLSCYAEFIDTGVVAALCESLPFEVVGATTLANAVGTAAGAMQLTLAVLTGDEAVTFSTAVTEPLSSGETQKKITDAYARAAEGHAQKPALVIGYLPLMMDVAGEYLWQTLADAAGDTPLFGTLATDHTDQFDQACILYGGEAYKDAMAMILVYGDISPRFLVAAVSQERIQKQKAVITDAEGYTLKAVNDVPILDYMQSLGLTRNDGIEAMRSLPFFIDYNDGGQPVARASLQITPEGYLLFHGFVPVDTRLSVGSLDREDVMRTARNTMEAAMETEDMHGMLIFPCVIRNHILGADMMAELQTVMDCIGARVPYMAAYSGGELCPVMTDQGKYVNRFHNFTFVACVL